MSKLIFWTPQLKQNYYICYLASPDIYCYFCKLILNNKICENVVFVTKVWSWLILYIRIRPQRSFNDFWHSPTRPNTFQVCWKCTWSFITTLIPQHKFLDYLHCINEDDFQYACATRAGGQSKCAHCFHLLFFWFQAACVHHTWWWTEAQLAIVFTYVFLSFFLLRLLLLTHFRKTPMAKVCFPQYFGITRRNI